MAVKRMLADVLWDAANKHLSPDGWWYPAQSMWSCNAVAKALTGDPDAVGTQICVVAKQFIRDCGCKVGVENYTFKQPEGEPRQGVRYIWLLLAMHVAEDEGITV